MTISPRELLILHGIERELSRDPTLTRLAGRFAGRPPHHPHRTRPALLVLALLLGIAGMVAGAVWTKPVLGGLSIIVLLGAGIVLVSSSPRRVLVSPPRTGVGSPGHDR
jgi:hypothetical protein